MGEMSAAMFTEIVRKKDAKIKLLHAQITAAIDMIENCAGVPTNPDSLPQMVKAHLRAALGRVEQQPTADAHSFVEETCNCGRVWRGKPGTNPATGCPDCGEDAAAESEFRRKNHYP